MKVYKGIYDAGSQGCRPPGSSPSGGMGSQVVAPPTPLVMVWVAELNRMVIALHCHALQCID